jgi:ribosomal protein S17E
MGRIKTVYVKRQAYKLLEIHGSRFNEDYAANKKVVSLLMKVPSTKMRNVIVGYVTRLKKQERIARRERSRGAAQWEPGEQRFSQRRRRIPDSMTGDLYGEMGSL